MIHTKHKNKLFEQWKQSTPSLPSNASIGNYEQSMALFLMQHKFGVIGRTVGIINWACDLFSNQTDFLVL